MSPVSALARAPSNIALIKYMGKEDSAANLPANGSISLTLDSLCTVAEVSRRTGATGVRWCPEAPGPVAGLAPRVPALGDAAVARMVRHVERVRAALPAIFAAHGSAHGLAAVTDGELELRAANTFPASSGIASSASSFAAVTLGVAAVCLRDSRAQDAFRAALAARPELRRALAALSRQGSGSSCRSFEGPWVLWEKSAAAALATPAMPALADLVLLIGAAPKQVSSSEAHSLVRTSPLYDGRAERVAGRIRNLEAALGEGDLPLISRVAWSEMWEMHSLFHTCADPFTYWEPGTVEALKWLAPRLKDPEPPIVTMDAGANVHVLVRESARAEWQERLRRRFPDWEILADRQGAGAELVETRLPG